MTDISKCGAIRNTEVCPLRNKCYRFTADSAGQYQPWVAPKWNGDECPYIYERSRGESEQVSKTEEV